MTVSRLTITQEIHRQGMIVPIAEENKALKRGWHSISSCNDYTGLHKHSVPANFCSQAEVEIVF